jgi:hypothetical protein
MTIVFLFIRFLTYRIFLFSRIPRQHKINLITFHWRGHFEGLFHLNTSSNQDRSHLLSSSDEIGEIFSIL